MLKHGEKQDGVFHVLVFFFFSLSLSSGLFSLFMVQF